MNILPFQPTARLVGAALLLGAVLNCAAQRKDTDRRPTLSPEESRRQGQAIIADLLARRPPENTTNTGVVRIRDAQGKKRETRVVFSVTVSPTNWVSAYETRPADHPEKAERLLVTHHAGGTIDYLLTRPGRAGGAEVSLPLSGAQLMTPFAGSDFWVADLGLDFLHWPEPQLLRKEMRHSRPAAVVETRSGHPSPGGYSRVVAWLDTDNGGVLHAEAYDDKGTMIKVFDPTAVKGHELAEMEMSSAVDDSRTWIHFDVDGK